MTGVQTCALPISRKVTVAAIRPICSGRLGGQDQKQQPYALHERQQQPRLRQRQHRTCEDGVNAAVRLPPAKGTVDARVVNRGLALCVLVDWQLLATDTPRREIAKCS